MRYLVKIATRSRVKEYMAAKQSLFDHASPGAQLNVITSVDADQYGLYAFPHVMQGSTLTIAPHTTKVDAINRGIPLEGWDVLINFSDDMRWVAPDWDFILTEMIREAWGDSLDFFAHLNDGFVGYKLPTMSVIGREYYERFFYIYPPCYKSVSCDAEAMFVAMMLGRHRYFDKVLFHHLHPVNTRKKYDELLMANDEHTRDDTDTFHRRLAKNFYVNGGTMVETERQFNLLKKRYA